MILKFFEKTEDLNKNNNNELINIACLMVHAAKIDENYTNKEREIIKNTLQKLNKSNQNIDKVFEDAEKREADANHIQEFTKNLPFHQLFYTCQCMAPEGPTYLKNHSLASVSLSLSHHHNQTDTLCIHYNLYNTEHQYIT